MEGRSSAQLPDVFQHYDNPPADNPEAMKDYNLTHDYLTGLLNQPGKDKALSYLLETMPGNFAVLRLDLDKFKDINDTQGHPAGNKLLKKVANTFTDTLRTDQTEAHPSRRKSPVAGVPDTIAARPHGDEFDVLLPGVKTREDAFAAGQRISNNLASLGITASFGSAVHEEGMDSEALETQSETELRVAKFRKRIEAFSSQPVYKRWMSHIGAAFVRRAGILPPDFNSRDF
jgi:GGDEF domain-containing protein